MGKINEVEIEPRAQDNAPAQKLKAPFPYYGGKSAVAEVVWERFDMVNLYIEPFFGSGAVWWQCPHRNVYGIVNDLNVFISNFWRAIRYAPKEVAHHARWPISEVDLYARQVWLNEQEANLRTKLEDPFYFDALIAGWWAWVMSSTIGPACINGRKVPHQKPHLTKFGGVNCFETEDSMAAYFELLKAKTERLKICNGYWHRVVTPVVLKENRQTAIFIDPPYDPKIRDGRLYSNESNVSKEAYAWAIAHGNHPNLRIAFCYYEGEHEFPADWEIYSWQANGGMANQNKDKDNENNRKERIAFSKYCIRPMERLF